MDVRIGDVVNVSGNRCGKVIAIFGTHLHVNVNGNLERVNVSDYSDYSDYSDLVLAGIIAERISIIWNTKRVNINEIADRLFEIRKHGEVINIENIDYYSEVILELLY